MCSPFFSEGGHPVAFNHPRTGFAFKGGLSLLQVLAQFLKFTLAVAQIMSLEVSQHCLTPLNLSALSLSSKSQALRLEAIAIRLYTGGLFCHPNLT